MRAVLSTLFALTLLLSATVASAKQASTDVGKLVMKAIEDIRGVVETKKGKIPEEQLDIELRSVINPIFDFAEMSKQSLGANWSKATPEEQREFTTLFSALLSNTYLSKVRKVDQTTISFLGENVNGNRALIKTNLFDKGDNVSLNYRVYLLQGKWMIYDIVIENISLASNYRSEFAGIVRKDGVAGLIKQLQEKKDDREAETAEKLAQEKSE